MRIYFRIFPFGNEKDCYYDVETKKLLISEDYTYVFDLTEKDWEKYILNSIDEYLEYNILENAEQIYFNSNHYNSFPYVFLKFKNVKKLKISGSRFLDLNCNQIPVFIEHLVLIHNSNLPLDVMKGSEGLINLHTLELDICPFIENDMFFDYRLINSENIEDFCNSLYNYDETYPIPDINSLKKVVLYTNQQGVDSIEYSNHDIIIKNHILFLNIKYRIKSIIFIYETGINIELF